MKYTKDQQKAIETRHKNILVAAAAGSGKTRVLVDRIIAQLLARECSVDEMLVVTFTNAAAAEMRERIDKALQQKLVEAEDRETIDWLERQLVLLSGASICTFHAFCQRVIRQNIEALDVDPQFRLASDQEMVLLRRDVLEELLEDSYKMPEDEEEKKEWQDFLEFADDYGDDHGDEGVYDAVLKLYNFCQSQPFPEDWLRAQQERFAYIKEGNGFWQTPWTDTIVEALGQEIERSIRRYEETCALVRINPDESEAGAEAKKSQALMAAWQPYVEYLQSCIEKMEDVQAAYRTAVLEKKAGGWDALAAVAKKWRQPVLRGKIYNDLRDNFPEVRQAFEKSRDEAKKIFTDARDKYLAESEKEVMAGLLACGATVRRYTNLTLRFIKALQAAKKERNILDFNDLEHFALAVLCADPKKLAAAKEEDFQGESGEALRTEAARDLREKYAVIMVDEYQDTNGVQEAILNLVAREDNRFTVGDVKQSIYRFRLADPYLFQQKYDTYPENPGEGDKNQLITMKQNFRSRAEVLAPINFIFDQVMHRAPMEIEYDEKSRLYPGADYPEHAQSLKGPMEIDIILRGGEDEISSASSQQNQQNQQDQEDEAEELEGFELEAQHIADRIAELMESGYKVFDKDAGGYRPLAYRDIAILLRAVKGKANTLLESLRKNSVPAYADVDGGYFEANEVRLVLALLKVIDNARQEIPLAAVLVSPIGGFTMEELARLRMSVPDEDLYGALLRSHSPETPLPEDLADRAADFSAALNSWRSYAVSHSVPELIWKLYRETGYYDYVGGLRGGLLRQANLRMLADRAAEYEKTNYRGLFRFLRFLEDLKKRDTDLSVARTLGASEDVVRIMSIHKSKGLEFPVVIVADIAKGFNVRDAQGVFLLHKELGIGPRLVERSAAGRQMYTTMPYQAIAARITAETKAEEMRVLYVAMTRAREKLILTGTIPAAHWEKMAARYCRGLDEQDLALPDEEIRQAGSYLDWIAPAVARHTDGKIIRQAADRDFGTMLDNVEPDAHFAVQLLQGNRIQPHEQEENLDDPILIAVRGHQPLPASAEKELVEKRLNWHYEGEELTGITAKMTVSEIKQRFAEEIREEEPASVPLVKTEENLVWRRPQFLQQKGRLSPSERGTLMHSIMQNLNLHGDLSPDGLRAQVSYMEAKGLIAAGHESAVNYRSIERFCASPLGKRLRGAKSIWRELPFSRMIPVGEVSRAYAESHEEIFIQGVIDVLFEEHDGSLVLLDYKTDRDTTPDKVRRHYAKQIELYREAVESVLKRKVKESILFMLQDGTIVTIGPEC
ncbi:helicase-exonuclease AddAB subunit AddA [Mitsuokella sp. WILCCON 0060]|uniref:helicase-exonuclease AddAB subunit AddA n=1 Tax=Mitsuokella sp. WILCCON 0060 TaxID=3345341 RepID=UPI003F1B1854